MKNRALLTKPLMARATNVVPSWKHRSVYWRTIVNRQFIDNNEIFVYVKNHGITEVFCLGRPCLTIHRLQKAQIDKFVPCGSTTSCPKANITLKRSKVGPRVQPAGDVTSQKKTSRGKIRSTTKKSEISGAKKRTGTVRHLKHQHNNLLPNIL
ncbi:uncharacterized protein LOC111271695 isoform X2 [Varroa jacobsoni]|uniref:Uncharacterized protein n=1 Tax=Varroa destructor TaxID=109461 RepID=A0A7M7J629_VARDE|nr:uncharacterized protein LOC111244326 isoform X1 [Varroa destructor]XP_022708386.1 uncharacterized protein LOC111271695 isoform X2 [Varroa jacobsoni]